MHLMYTESKQRTNTDSTPPSPPEVDCKLQGGARAGEIQRETTASKPWIASYEEDTAEETQRETTVSKRKTKV